MSGRVARAALLAAALLPLAVPAEAQRDAHAAEALVEGRRWISFRLPFHEPERTGVFQYTSMRSERTALGLEVEVHGVRRTISAEPVEPRSVQSSLFLRAGPVVRRYLTVQRVVAPYVRGSAAVGVERVQFKREATTFFEEVDVSDWGWRAAVGAGVGVDWFPFERVSLGGFTGVEAGYASPPGPSNPVTMDRSELSLTTLTTGLELSIYF